MVTSTDTGVQSCEETPYYQKNYIRSDVEPQSTKLMKITSMVCRQDADFRRGVGLRAANVTRHASPPQVALRLGQIDPALEEVAGAGLTHGDEEEVTR